MMSWIKGLFGRPTKSDVIRDTILTLAKDRTLLESALSLSDEMDKHKAKKAAKPEHVPVTAAKCIDATERIAELAAKGLKYAAIARTLNRNGFFYQTVQSRGLRPFNDTDVKHLVLGRIVYNSKKGYYVCSDRELQRQKVYDAKYRIRVRGHKK